MPGGVQFHIRDLAEYPSSGSATRSPSRPRRRPIHPAAAVRRLSRAARRRSRKRLGGPLNLFGFPGGGAGAAPAALTRAFRRHPHPHRPDLALARPADLLGGAGPRSWRPSTRPTRAPLDDRRVLDPPGRPGEDQRPHRGERARPPQPSSSTSAGDAVVIPNGVDVDFFAGAEPKPEWQGDTIGFIGRIDEPRKGLPVHAGAAEDPRHPPPGARLLVAGRAHERRRPCSPARRCALPRWSSSAWSATRTRPVPAQRRPAAWRPTPAASFGIILVEAMSAGAPVLALRTWTPSPQVLDQGAAGELFPNEDAAAPADACVRLLADLERRNRPAGAGCAQRPAVRR
ncbi:glycosyltransferase [Streptomyces thinghirensis]|nr:glycosyltransferase [Streptomyces thinghirensis]